jgi:hypothetical protein
MNPGKNWPEKSGRNFRRPAKTDDFSIGGAWYRMRRLALFFVAVTVAASTAAHADSARDCTLKEFASLDIAFESGAMTVPVKIAGVDRRLAVDLSIPDTGVRESLANELQLKQSPLPPGIGTVGYTGDKVTTQVVLPDFEIGPLTLKNAKVLVFAGSKLPSDVAGVLGTGLFAKLDAEIDFTKAKLNLFSPDHCEGNVVYWTDKFASFPFRLGEIRQTYLRADLDDTAVRTSFTTDGTNSSMTLSSAKRLFDLTPDSPGMTVTARNADGTPSIYRYPSSWCSVALPSPIPRSISRWIPNHAVTEISFSRKACL